VWVGDVSEVLLGGNGGVLKEEWVVLELVFVLEVLVFIVIVVLLIFLLVGVGDGCVKVLFIVR